MVYTFFCNLICLLNIFKIHPCCGMYLQLIHCHCCTLFHSLNISQHLILLLTFKTLLAFYYYHSAALNIPEHISLYTCAKGLLGYTLRSAFADSQGICIYSLITDDQVSVHHSYTSFHCHQQYIKVPITLHPHLYLEFSYLLNFANLMSVKLSYCSFNLHFTDFL